MCWLRSSHSRAWALQLGCSRCRSVLMDERFGWYAALNCTIVQQSRWDARPCGCCTDGGEGFFGGTERNRNGFDEHHHRTAAGMIERSHHTKPITRPSGRYQDRLIVQIVCRGKNRRTYHDSTGVTVCDGGYSTHYWGQLTRCKRGGCVAEG